VGAPVPAADGEQSWSTKKIVIAAAVPW